MELVKDGTCYKAVILADSFNWANNRRLTTFEITYPRFVHAEFMTHRVFSRNAASSRAIPNKKLIERLQNNPALPVWWGKNQKGMQARQELDSSEKEVVQKRWLEIRDQMIAASKELADLGLHKQLCNRLLEPWMPITVIASGTEWSNFFHLRCHPDAQPEIKEIAEMMRELYKKNNPKGLRAGEWHRPLIFEQDKEDVVRGNIELPNQGPAYIYDTILNKISVGRCARVSYLTHDGKRELGKDVELCDRLSQNGHWSPFEHVARAMDEDKGFGNFRGWKQYRKYFKNEHYQGEF